MNGTQLKQDSNSSYELLEEGNITLQGMHDMVLSICLSALSHACMGIEPYGNARRTLTDESVSMRPPLSLTRERASRPA
jgi:hypothetical protein